MTVWPIVVAREEVCCLVVCPSCGDFNLPLSYALKIQRRCPFCERIGVDVRQQAHSHWWALQVNRKEKEFLLRVKIDPDRLYCVTGLSGPYEDWPSAVVGMSVALGWTLSKGQA